MVKRLRLEDYNEFIDLEADGYDEVHSPDPNYSVYRKTVRDSSGKIVRGVWAAQEIDRNTFKPIGNPFEITYDQARGFEPIKDTASSKLGRQVAKALKMSDRRYGVNESRSMRTSSIKEDTDGEYAVNGHWLASATYADGTEVEKEFPYTAENYREEQEEQYRLESWLLSYHPDCTWYSVSFVEDW